MFSHRIDADVELKLLEVKHAEAMHALTSANNAHLKQWLPARDTDRTLAETRQLIRDFMQTFVDGTGVECGIWYRGKFAGTIGCRRISPTHRRTVVGYWLGAGFEGKGLVTKTFKAMLDYAFEELKLNRVEVFCATENVKSRAIPERLGFTHEGVIRQAEWLTDHYVDHAVYSLLAEEWLKQRSKR